MKLITQKQQEAGAQSLQASSKLKASQQPKDADEKSKLKARIQNLEKSYEVLKSKHKESED